MGRIVLLELHVLSTLLQHKLNKDTKEGLDKLVNCYINNKGEIKNIASKNIKVKNEITRLKKVNTNIAKAY